MKKIFILFISVFLTVQTSFAQNYANKLYEKNVKSALLVETQSAYGTGVILTSDGTFITAFHVISNADYIKVKTKDGKEYKADGYRYLNPKEDIAILTLKLSKQKNNSKTEFTPAKINDNIKPVVGDDIYTISNPAGLDFSFQKGMINRINEDEIQFSAPTSEGSSGGALFNSTGDLIGLISYQYLPSKTQNINFAIPTSKFLPYIQNKKNVNVKNLPWSEFVAQRLTDKELNEFVDYAEKQDDISMLYKYFKQYGLRDDIPSYRYALMGTLAISGYLDDISDNKYLLDDAKKWFALSILSAKNVEASSYGLLLSALLRGEENDLECIYHYIKKYPITVKKAAGQMDSLLKCDTDDFKCAKRSFFEMCRYLQFLTGKGYK